METKLCITCNGTITKAKWEGRTRWNNHKYCSLQCRQVWNKGLTKKDPRVKKNFAHSKSTQFKKGQTLGEKNANWKGQEASYTAKHMWIRYHYGTPKKCEHCEATEDKMYHWANISGDYLRERDDYIRLCVSCHKRYDIKRLAGKIKKRVPKVQPTKICTECGTEFTKNPRLSKKQWETTYLCSKQCSSKVIARKKLGIKQSAETKALKSQKLKERWATNQEWREHVTSKMIGNQYAKKDQGGRT